ncbi:uncharacterized protein LOC100708920 isoform X2 [Oreochromis niloticus]|uniref:uncharacterized protein LOC100708920 isoform X2 n=1 Tax=Oreochromis niloticus TaxID=8128 RepID=UPI00039469B0|nr:uncharacterized protein LOC100708920 isoform X2 [Oreochromis niloticus]
MLTSEHRKTHGFNSAGRFLTTYKKDYGPIRERYPHLNSRDEPPPSSAFMSSFGVLTPSISVATQDVGSALMVHWTQDAGVARGTELFVGQEDESQRRRVCDGCGGKGVVVLSSTDGPSSCNDFLRNLLRESGLQHLLSAPQGWSAVDINKDDQHLDKSAFSWGLSASSLQNPLSQGSRCARGPECFELKTICQSSALPQAHVQPATETRRKLPQTEYQFNYGPKIQSGQRKLCTQQDAFSDRPPCHWSSV